MLSMREMKMTETFNLRLVHPVLSVPFGHQGRFLQVAPEYLEDLVVQVNPNEKKRNLSSINRQGYTTEF